MAWAACAAGGRWEPVRGCRPSEAPSALPPDDPAWACRISSLPRVSRQGLSKHHNPARAARPLLRELPRCARRSPSAPRNASARLRVAWEIAPDVSSGRVHCILMGDSCDYSWCSVQPDSSLLSVCSFVPPARRAGGRACSCILACRSIERHVPYGHGGISFYVDLAASGGGRWGPVRGCRPSEAPSALPPDDPAGLVAYLHSHGVALRGFPYAVIPRGLRGLRSGSFLAALGDLPPRHAMPAHAFALHGKLTKMSHRVGCIAY